MANSSIQKDVECWVRAEWMRERFGGVFVERNAPLESGGRFRFDAVNEDGSVVACVSTGGAKTDTGRAASAKFNKLRADMLFLVMATGCRRRLLIVTDRSMVEWLAKERSAGRVPGSIEVLHAVIPDALARDLATAQRRAAMEMRLGNGNGEVGPQ